MLRLFAILTLAVVASLGACGVDSPRTGGTNSAPASTPGRETLSVEDERISAAIRGRGLAALGRNCDDCAMGELFSCDGAWRATGSPNAASGRYEVRSGVICVTTRSGRTFCRRPEFVQPGQLILHQVEGAGATTYRIDEQTPETCEGL